MTFSESGVLMNKMNYATYQYVPERHGKGTFYYPDCCGHEMYSVKGPEAYHGCLCPKCFYKGKLTTLYMRGTDEANKVIEEREKERQIQL